MTLLIVWIITQQECLVQADAGVRGWATVGDQLYRDLGLDQFDLYN